MYHLTGAAKLSLLSCFSSRLIVHRNFKLSIDFWYSASANLDHYLFEICFRRELFRSSTENPYVADFPDAYRRWQMFCKLTLVTVIHTSRIVIRKHPVLPNHVKPRSVLSWVLYNCLPNQMKRLLLR